MVDVLEWSAFALAVALSLPMLIFSIEAFLGMFRTPDTLFFVRFPRTCIMIPAHNEAAVITTTLKSLLSVVQNNVRIVVVADNCSDDTAMMARNLNVDVFERSDPEKRGKGFALAFGRDSLSLDPPECVIVLDADCRIDAGSIADIAKSCHLSGSAVQARNILEANLSLPPKVQISNFAFWIKNIVRQRGVSRIGGGAILAGTGMAFPWQMFAALPLATGDIVEDLALSVNLTKSGHPPLFLEQATVTSPAAPEHATLQQRSRWEHGFLGVAATHGFSAVWRGISKLDLQSLLLGLHLMVPPLAMLFALAIVSALFFSMLGILFGYWLPFIVVVSMLSAMATAILLNWAIEGHQWLSPKALISLPAYVLWKLPVYGKLLAGKTSKWVRTDRG